MVEKLSVDQLMEIVDRSVTDDKRLIPDYADSYILLRVVIELAERAYMYESVSD